MALRSTLSRYKSLSRPSTGGSQSSYFSTLARRSEAAQDDVVDHNYEIGILSASEYLNELSKRTTRTYLTPLQRTNLTQKMEKVKEDYVDAQYQNLYKAGQVTDRQMYEYEKGKLDKMSAATGAAYQNQAAKVQGLLDKAEKSERKEYRQNELLRISKLPEDTSQKIAAKVAVYKNLWDQAIADGDEGEARALETNYNNYSVAASKAEITDQINEANRLVAKTGQNIPYNLDGSQQVPVSGESPMTTGGGMDQGVSVASGSPGASAGTGIVDDGGILNNIQERYNDALTRDANIKQDLQGLGVRRGALVKAKEMAKAKGLVDMVGQIDAQIVAIDNASADLKDRQAGNKENLKEIQLAYKEAQQGLAYKSRYGELQNDENTLLDAEQNLDIELQTGKLTKEQYLQERRDNIRDKAELYGKFANLYGEFDKTNPAADATRKAQREELKNLREVQDMIVNPGRLELVEGGDGNVKLTDVYNQKVSRTFETDYVKDGNVFRRIYIPDGVDESGNPLFLNSAIKRGFAVYNDEDDAMAPFVIKRDEKGNMIQVQVSVVDGKPMFREEKRALEKEGSVVKTNTGYTIKKPVEGAGGVEKTFDAARQVAKKIMSTAAEAGKAVGQGVGNLSPAYRQATGKTPYQYNTIDLSKFTQGAKSTIKQLLDRLKNVNLPIPVGLEDRGGGVSTFKTKDFNIGKSPWETFGVTNMIGNIFNKAKEVGSKTIQSFMPQPVQAAEGDLAMARQGGTSKISGGIGAIIDRIAERYAPGDNEFKKIMHAIALAESGGRPDAIGDRGVSIGLYQNNMAGGRGRGHTKVNLMNPEYNTDLAARELIRYYKQGVQKGFSGAKLTAYVSRYGQRPAAGNERYAAAKYGQYVFGGEVVKPTPMPTPDYTYDGVIEKPKEEKRSWYDPRNLIPKVGAQEPSGQIVQQKTQQPSAVRSLQPTFAQQPKFSQPVSVQMPKVAAPSAQMKFTPPSLPSYNPIQTFKTNVQKAASAVRQAPKVAGNVVNTVKNVLGKLKFW